MVTNMERRLSERHSYSVPIVFSFFNQRESFKAHTHNYCEMGMGFESDIPLKPGATIFIRVKKFYPNKSCTDPSYGLRSVGLVDVKWCREGIDVDKLNYSVGVEYYASVY
jgi:hypothetical protein